MLMRPDHARVDGNDPFEVADGVVFDDHPVEDPVPGAVLGPQPQPFMRRLPGPVTIRQVTPGRTSAQLPQDRVDDLTVIPPPPPTTLPRRQQWLDHRPCFVRQLTTTNHDRNPTEPQLDHLQDTP